MSLIVNDNISSLIAENALNQTSNAASTSLQRLSTGLKINSGADGPAALVISEQQQAQISGLQAAIQNTQTATSAVQTTEGALSEVNDLLTQIRALAVDSANSGVQDSSSLAANQEQVSNALSTIDRIAANTQFGTKKVLDGSAGFNGSADTAGISFERATDNASDRQLRGQHHHGCPEGQHRSGHRSDRQPRSQRESDDQRRRRRSLGRPDPVPGRLDDQPVHRPDRRHRRHRRDHRRHAALQHAVRFGRQDQRSVRHPPPAPPPRDSARRRRT